MNWTEFKNLSGGLRIVFVLFLLFIGYFTGGIIGIIVATLISVYIIYRSRK